MIRGIEADVFDDEIVIVADIRRANAIADALEAAFVGDGALDERPEYFFAVQTIRSAVANARQHVAPPAVSPVARHLRAVGGDQS